MLPLVFPLLAGAPAVTALVGTAPVRVYRHGSAPQNVASPYVTWSVTGGDAEIVFDQTDADTFRVSVDCWASGTAGDTLIETLAAAVRAAIEPAAHLVGYIADERDFDTQKFRISMAFDFIVLR